MDDGDAVGGLLVGLIEAGEGLAGISGLVVSCGDLPVKKTKTDSRCFYPDCQFPVNIVCSGLLGLLCVGINPPDALKSSLSLWLQQSHSKRCSQSESSK